jgi:serine/threonine-protein kinase
MMTLGAGTNIGPYSILSQVGAGGQGEVYKARDTRLNRFVAVKVLPERLSQNPELKARFEREAQTLAKLSHPHICSVFDIGRHDGTDYIVMEFLEGETLARRLDKGELPLDEALKIAIGIVDALAKAHRQGVVHRDVKPSNVMLTKTGAKLLDFGLAKFIASKAVMSVSEMPTGVDVTAQGTIIGTLQYMSPEQLEGQEADARSDIFACGTVMYEMLTGRKAFEGRSQSGLIAAIMHVDPPRITEVKSMIPPALARVVKMCLAKDPDQRWQSAHDLATELQWIGEGGPDPANSTANTRSVAQGWRRMGSLAVVSSLLGAAVAAIFAWNLKPVASLVPAPPGHFVLSLPPGQQLADVNFPVIAVSPDGSRLAYVARGNNTPQQIYIRPLNSPDPNPLPGTEDAAHPFFSPDGEWLAFFTGNKLMKVPLRGGSPLTICSPGGDYWAGGTWGADGQIVFQNVNLGDLLRVSADGGTPERLTTLNSKSSEQSSRWPEFLPGFETLLFTTSTIASRWQPAQISLYNLRTRERRDLQAGTGTRPRYIPTGYLSYANAGTLMAVAFDSQKMKVLGPPVPIADRVTQSDSSGVAQYSFSDNGVLTYVSGGVLEGLRKMVWVDRKGKEQAINAPPRDYSRNPRLSPDGHRVAIPIAGVEIWVYDLERQSLNRLTFEGSAGGEVPSWTPDGKYITFNSGFPLNLYWQAADGTGKAERLSTSANIQAINSWTPDGQIAAFVEIDPITATDVWIFRARDRKAEPFLKTPFNEGAPAFSPDGHWLAYSSDESGHTEIYVQPYPGPGGKWQVSTDGGTEPVWNHNSKEMFYRSGNKMMAVDVKLEPSFSAGIPKMLFEGPYVRTPGTFPNYDVSPDGQRFLMLKSAEQESAPTQIHVVLNWFDELKRRVPGH